MANRGHAGRWMVAALMGLLLASCDQPAPSDGPAGDNGAVADGNVAAAPDAVDTPAAVATDATGDAPVPTPSASPMPTPVASDDSMPVSCEAEIGRASARKLATQCRQVSGATHPPCNIANSCAIIQDEIDRNCGDAAPGDSRPDACGPVGDTVEQAADVIRRYYSAINAGDYATAYAAWGNDGRASGKSFTGFRKGFDDTRSVRVSIGTPGEPEGAAGSIYVEIPVAVDATLDDGTRQHFTGTYTLRRVNDVPGSSQAQRRWHLESARLRPSI